MGDIKFYSPVDFDDTSSGVTIEGDIQLGSFNKISGADSDNLVIAVDTGNTSGGSSIDFQVDGANSAMFINNSRNVGIGTTSPGRTLDVAGKGRFIHSTSTVDILGASTYIPLLISNTGGYAHARINGFEVGGNTTATNEGYIKTSDNSRRLFLDTNGWRFVSTNTEIMRLTPAGNLGIGTTSPAHKLTINASNNTTALGIDFPSAHFDFSANSTSGYTTSFHMDDTATTIGSNSAVRALIFQTNNTDRLYINGNTGNVGIGTTSPSEKLGVISSDNIGTTKIISAYSLSQSQSTSLGYNSIMGSYSLNVATLTTQPITFSPNSSEAMRITSTGNVGIGTTSPSQALEVNGIIKISNTYKQYLLQSHNTYGNLLLQQSGAATIPLTVNSANLGIGVGNISLQSALNVNGGIAAGSYYNTAAPANGMIISGNVGIGTTSPNSKLHVAGAVKAGDSSTGISLEIQSTDEYRINGIDTGGAGWNSLHLRADGTDGLFIQKDTNNVGIGTTSPGTKLHVHDDDGAIIRLSSNAHTDQNKIEFDALNNGTVYHSIVSNTNTGNLQLRAGDSGSGHEVNIYTDGSFAATFDNNQNLGIGITSPDSVLHVQQDKVTLNTTNLDNGTAVGLHLTYPDTSLSGGEGIALAMGMNGRGRSYIANLSASTNKDSSDMLFYTENGGVIGERMRIANAGNVGIGTTSPSEKLEVDGNIKSKRITLSHDGYAGYIKQAGDFGGGPLYIVNQGQNHDINFQGNKGGTTSTSLHIDGLTHNVGIGTTSPGARLDVKVASSNLINNIKFGDNTQGYLASGTTGVYLSDSSGTARLMFTHSGNVGIGTSSPTSFNSRGRNLVVNSDGDTGITISANTTSSSTLLFADSFAGTGGTSTYRGIIEYDHSVDSMAFSTSAAERIRIASGGNVGIGTSSPNAKLHIGPDSLVSSYTPDRSTLAISDTTNGGQLIIRGQSPRIWFDATAGGNAELFLDGSKLNILSGTPISNGSSRLYIKADGNVGIGTTSPGEKLEIANAGSVNLKLNNTSGGLAMTIGAQASACRITAESGDDLRLGAGGTADTLNINSSSNVGIGTSSPTQKLHVVGNARVTGAYYDSNNSPGTADQVLVSTVTGTDWQDLSDISGVDGTGTANTVAMWSDTDTITDAPITVSGNNATFAGTLRLPDGAVSAPSIHNTGDTNTGMYWPGDHQLGFAVNGSRKMYMSTTRAFFQNLSSGVMISAGGIDVTGASTFTDNVGIGTTSPSEKLDVAGSIVVNTGQSLKWGTGATRIVGVDGSYIAMYPNNSEKVRFLSNGNVLIGTTTDNGDKLTVAGTISTTHTGYTTDAFKVTHNSNDVLLSLYRRADQSTPQALIRTGGVSYFNGGNVGIGTTSPAEKLHVAGDVKIQGDLNLEGDLDFRVINSGGFGQPGISLPNFSDVFYRADRRFTVTVVGGASVSGLFDGSYSNLINLVANTTHKITINVANQSGVSANGFTYPQGYIYISFYSTTNNYDSISGRVKDKDGNYYNMSGLTDIIPNDSNYKVMRLTVPSNNYIVEYEITVVTATDNVRLAAINYVSTRHTSQMELPYLSKTLDTNRLFGNVDVLTNASADQNRLSGTGNSYLAASTGNVGIGTSNPSQLLDVQGTILVNNEIQFVDSNMRIFRSSNDMRIRTGGSDKVTINSSGNVGIGTTSPVEKLDVHGNIRINTGSELRFNNANVGAYRDSNDLRLAGYNSIQFLSSTTSMGSQTERMRITNAGNVGIGTSSPSSKLHVYNGEAIIATSTDGLKLSYSVGNSSGIIDTAFSDNNLEFRTNGTTKMWIANAGNVGIGTTSPLNKLQVTDGSIGIDSQYAIRDNRNNTILQQSADTLPSNRTLTIGNATYSNIVIPNGNVGIGTTSPDVKLHVGGNAKASNIYIADSIIHTGDVDTKIDFSTDGIGFDTAGSEKMNISSTGKVSISGTEDELLSLNATDDGAVYMSFERSNSRKGYVGFGGSGVNFSIANEAANGGITISAGGGEKMRIEAGGDVGIGTTNPSQKLHVDGHTLISAEKYYYVAGGGAGVGSDASGNLILRQNSANLMTTSGSNATFTGNLKLGDSNQLQLGDDADLVFYSDNTQTLMHNYNNNLIIKQDATDGDIIFQSDNGSGGTTEYLVLDGSTTHAYFSNPGSVGIGTTSPSNKLHVVGSQRIDQSADWDGLNIYGFDDQSSDYIKLHIGTSPMARYQSNLTHSFYVGNSRSLDIAATAIDFKVNTGYSDDLISILGTNKDSYIGYSNTDNRLKIGFGSLSNPTVDSNTKLSLDASGVYVTDNFGIGTTSPSEKLHVFGGAAAIEIDSTTNEASLKYDNSTTTATIKLANNDLKTELGGSEKMRIDSAGNVGIGFTSLVNQLDVNGVIMGTGIRLGSQASGEGIMRVNGTGNGNGLAFTTGSFSSNYVALYVDHSSNNGKVGIGTTSPSEKLHIADSDDVNIYLESTDTTVIAGQSYGGLIWKSNDGSGIGARDTGRIQLVSSGAVAESDMLFFTTDYNVAMSEKMRITSGGNVGIGTTSPAAPLDVNGNIQITGGSNTLIFDNSTIKWQQYVNTNEFTLRYYNGSNWNERLRVDTDGNVGIGTTNPEAKLHVTDSIRIDTGGAGPSAAPTTGTPTQAQVRNGGDETYYLSEPDTWLTVNIGGTDYVIPAYEA